MKSLLAKPSLSITCAMASNNATSEPTRSGRYKSDRSANPIRRGSATINLLPLAMAFLMPVAATG